jgi:hypothetical protein
MGTGQRARGGGGRKASGGDGAQRSSHRAFARLEATPTFVDAAHDVIAHAWVVVKKNEAHTD